MLVGGLSVVYCHAGLYKARKPGTRKLLNRTAHKFGSTPGLKGIGITHLRQGKKKGNSNLGARGLS